MTRDTCIWCGDECVHAHHLGRDGFCEMAIGVERRRLVLRGDVEMITVTYSGRPPTFDVAIRSQYAFWRDTWKWHDDGFNSFIVSDMGVVWR